MADFYISRINPIRFTRDGVHDMPRIDEMRNGTQYYRGVYPLPNYKDSWKLNEPIVIQIQSDLSFASADQVELNITLPSGSTQSVAGVNVTPSGWLVNGVLGFVYNYTYTPTISGTYSIRTENEDGLDNYGTGEISVAENDMNLVEFEYYDSKNSFDGVFYDNGTLIWSPKAYFTGIQEEGEPISESDIYTNDTKTPTRTRGTMQLTIDISLTDITRKLYSQLKSILTCDTNYVNGQRAINVDELNYEPVDKSDATSVLFNMIRVEDNNFVKNV